MEAPRIMQRLLLALCLALPAPAALAAAASGAELLQRCSAYENSLAGKTVSAEDSLDAMWCMGYVSGLLDGFSVSDFRIGEAVAVCPPQSAISRSQALALILDWLRQHPEEHANSGRRSAILALSRAYPCSRQ